MRLSPWFVAIFAMLMPALALAQETSGTIAGVVRDPSNAMLAQAIAMSRGIAHSPRYPRSQPGRQPRARTLSAKTAASKPRSSATSVRNECSSYSRRAARSPRG